MLSDVEIRGLLDDGLMRIEPFDEAMLRPSSYALRLGQRILELARFSAVDVASADTRSDFEPLATTDDRVVLGGGGFFLAASLETVALSEQVSGLLSLGSRFARLGLVGNGGAALVQAGFGQDSPTAVTLELLNATPRPVALRVGMPFCHLVLFRHRTAALVKRARRSADLGPHPSPARFP